MDGGEWTVGLLMALVVLLAVSKTITWQRTGGPARLLAYVQPWIAGRLRMAPSIPLDNRHMHTMIPRGQPQRVYPPASRSRTQTRAERQIIRAALAAGVDARAVAAALRGSPAYNRRRVRELAERIQRTA